MAEVASAVVALIPSFKGGRKKITEELDGPIRESADETGRGYGSRFAESAKAALGPLLATFSAAAVAQFFSGAIDEASGLNESLNALNVTYGENADAVAALGTQAADTLGLSNLEFNNLAVRFSSFANTIAGEGGNVTGTLDDLTSRAADFASVMNLDVADAAQLFQSGLAGESEPLRQYGIDLSAATVQAYAYANGIAEQGEQLTEAQRIQATYGSLMEQTANTQGDFANTSDQLANQQRILAARWADARAELGQALLPALASLTTVAANAVGGLSGLGDWFRQNQGIITTVASIVGTVLLPVIIRLGVQSTISAAKQVAAWAVSGAGAVAAAAKSYAASVRIVAGWVLMGLRATANAAIQVAAWAILGTASAIHAARMAASWVVGVIAPAATATAVMVANVARQVAAWVLLGVQSLIQAARVAAAWLIAMGPIGVVIALVVGLVALIIANWDKIRNFTVNAWGAIVAWLKNAWSNIKSTAVNIWNSLVSWITGVPGRITSGLASLGSALRTKMSTWIGNVKQAAVDKFNSLVDWVRGIPDRIVSALGNVGSLLYDAGANILSGFLDGLKSGWSAVTGWVGGIGDWIANNKGPKSYDLALLVPAGRWIMQGLQAGLESEQQNLERTLQGVSSAIAGHRFGAAAVSASAASGGSMGAGSHDSDLRALADYIVEGMLVGSDRLASATVGSQVRHQAATRQTAGVLR